MAAGGNNNPEGNNQYTEHTAAPLTGEVIESLSNPEGEYWAEYLKPLKSDKQRLFVLEYLRDANQTQAAIRAGYAAKGAANQGAQLMDHAGVKAAIAAAMAARVKRTEIDADWMLMHLGDQIKADLADIYFPNGGIKPIHEWPLIWRQGLVAGIETRQEYAYIDGEKVPDGIVMKVKLVDRTKLLQMAGNHVDVQAFREQKEVKVGIESLIDELTEA